MKKILGILFVSMILMGCYAQAGPVPVEITWTAPGDNFDVGTASSYIIAYSIEPITEANWETVDKIPESLDMVPNIAGTPETLSVTLQLLSETTYYFRAIACDEVPNCSDLSNEANINIPDIDPPNTPVISIQIVF